MTHDFAISRRDLLKAGGALLVSIGLLPQARPALAAAGQPAGSLATAVGLDAWIRIDADGTVTAFTGKVEFGQGIKTALAQVVAEELDVALERLRIITADTDRTPNEGYTSGSWSMAMSGTALQWAAAQARAILLQMAAAGLRVPREQLQIRDGTIMGPGDQRQTTYWDLMGGRFFRYAITGAVPPKPPSAHRIVGTSVPRLDMPAKVHGGVAYVQDLRLPGMVHARVVRPPSYGARLLAVDADAVAGMVRQRRNIAWTRAGEPLEDTHDTRYLRDFDRRRAAWGGMHSAAARERARRDRRRTVSSDPVSAVRSGGEHEASAESLVHKESRNDREV